MSIRFGTGGWRAIIGDDFIKSNIRILAEAMARKMKREQVLPRLAIGYVSWPRRRCSGRRRSWPPRASPSSS